jgi:hypothetical protein
MLAVGGAVTPVWTHDVCDESGGKGKHSPDHPHCVDGTTNDGNLYDVSVSGALILGTKTGHDGVGKKESVSVNWDFLDMDLGFIQNELVVNGDACLGEAPVDGYQTALGVGHDKTGNELVATYWFSGYGTDGTTRIGYRLTLSTEDDDSGWRPTVPGYDGRSELLFNEWELYHRKDIACIGSGNFGGEGTTIRIILKD